MFESGMGAILALLGLGLGIFLSRYIRRSRDRSQAAKRAATPPVYASRQQMRKAERQRKKADGSL